MRLIRMLLLTTLLASCGEPQLTEAAKPAAITCGDGIQGSQDISGPTLGYAWGTPGVVLHGTWVFTRQTPGWYYVVMQCPTEAGGDCATWPAEGYAQQNGNSLQVVLMRKTFNERYQFNATISYSPAVPSLVITGTVLQGWNRVPNGFSIQGGGNVILTGGTFNGAPIRCPAPSPQGFVSTAHYTYSLNKFGGGRIGSIFDITSQSGSYVTGQIQLIIHGIPTWEPLDGTTYSNNDLTLLSDYSGDSYYFGPPNWFAASLASPVHSVPIQIAGPWYAGFGHIQPGGLATPNFSARSP